MAVAVTAAITTGSQSNCQPQASPPVSTYGHMPYLHSHHLPNIIHISLPSDTTTCPYHLSLYLVTHTRHYILDITYSTLHTRHHILYTPFLVSRYSTHLTSRSTIAGPRLFPFITCRRYHSTRRALQVSVIYSGQFRSHGTHTGHTSIYTSCVDH